MNKIEYRAVLLGLGLAVMFGCRHHGDQRASIAEYGVFEARSGKNVKASETSLKYLVALDDIRLVEQTESVVATKGVRFGIRYRIEGRQDVDPVVVTIKLRHPAITDPTTKTSSTVELWQQRPKVDGLTYAGFTMDSEWEMVPGKWTFEIWGGDAKLAEQTFSVRKE